MRSAIALRHVAFEDLGSFAPVLARHGFEVSYREAALDDFADPALERTDLLIVLGGPIGAYEEALYPFVIDELRTIERRLGAGKAVLGICLGSQLMARALGARVYPGHGKEIGWSPLVLSEAGQRSPLAAFAAGQPVLHWHGDTFDLPAGAVHLAASDKYRNQAFAWQRHGLALQFHIEAEARGLERWYIGHAGELAATEGIDVPGLRRDAERFAPRLAPLAARCLESWLETAFG